MNKSYRSIWNEKVGTFVAVAETAMARGKSTSSVARADSGEAGSHLLEREGHSGLLKGAMGLGASMALLFGGAGGFGGAQAVAAPSIASCTSGTGWGFSNTSSGSANNNQCGGSNAAAGLGTSFTGVYLTDNTSGPTAWMSVGSGYVKMGASTSIQMLQYLDMTSHSITNLTAGAINASSTDAVNGSQLFSMSNSLSTVVSSTSLSLSTNVSSMSTGMSSLSTAWSSASTSLSTNMSSVSTAWSTASSSVSTSMSSISTAWSSVSASTSTVCGPSGTP
ncbi:ESPR-type extended signal peptide-containing protein [Caballeronia sp. Lep1P3]|uniref:ESPR-type extended signal peptide-containing protein n=1 Tax=Caballeronia sp. Lep1P3 TaxID=2878150 RepID=UPI00351DA4E2